MCRLAWIIYIYRVIINNVVESGKMMQVRCSGAHTPLLRTDPDIHFLWLASSIMQDGEGLLSPVCDLLEDDGSIGGRVQSCNRGSFITGFPDHLSQRNFTQKRYFQCFSELSCTVLAKDVIFFFRHIFRHEVRHILDN